MNSFFWSMFIFLVLQRLGELILSRRNESRLRLRGAYEAGRSHYKYIVLLHILFLVSLLAEVQLRQTGAPSYWPLFFSLFCLAQALRYWSILTLGGRWTTRIIILPDAPRIMDGPYRFISHPNYVAVVCEILVIPLIFGAYLTAIIFTILNAVMLTVRIKEEASALSATKRDLSPVL